jgi:hypothetical protein
VRILVRHEPEVEFYTVAANEVPADHVPIHLAGLGECYAPPELVRTINSRAGYVHPEFPPDVRERFRRLERVFDGVYPRTVEQWEDGFRRDAYPWDEIATSEWLADVIERFTAHLTGEDPTTREKRKDVADLVLCLSHIPAETRKTILKGRADFPGVSTLSKGRVREIATWMFAHERAAEKNARREQLRKLIQGRGLPGPDRVSVDALFDLSGTGYNRDADFHPADLVNAADVILGVSREDGHEFLVYGKDFLERIVRTGKEESGTLLRVELDPETDDVEKLVALITRLKGRHDLQGGG